MSDYRPELVLAPAALPVSIDEAKRHLRVDHDDDSDMITALIETATAHLDGYSGVLGRAIVSQEWRETFDGFRQAMRLRLPVLEISSITWRNSAGQISTVAEDDYALKADAVGSFVRFRNASVLPADLYESEAVSIVYVAGYGEVVDGQPNPVPGPIRSAILLMVGDLYRFRETAETEGASAVEMSLTVERLIAPYRLGSL